MPTGGVVREMTLKSVLRGRGRATGKVDHAIARSCRLGNAVVGGSKGLLPPRLFRLSYRPGGNGSALLVFFCVLFAHALQSDKGGAPA